jgi:hypothetical protein
VIETVADVSEVLTAQEHLAGADCSKESSQRMHAVKRVSTVNLYEHRFDTVLFGLEQLMGNFSLILRNLFFKA